MAPIQFGVLLIEVQAIDIVGPLDLLSSSSKPYIQSLEKEGWGSGLSEKGIDIEYHYIAATLEPVKLSANIMMVPSITYENCPPLDYLLIGGPETETIQNLSHATVEFIRSRSEEVKTVFTTCTGGMVAAATGILDGKTATTNHGAIPVAKQIFPKVNWTLGQWETDGKFWTAGGACAGMDMMAQWIRDGYGEDVAKFSYMALDYQPRDVERKLIDAKI